ncbi:hypothetical protein GGR57DRAFT_485093 [Xylariaceae sp. FL1272]|nr:hypothetical protein GGR57DRAFT_485093 [Xylariaceae sp. FL1272]
MLPPTSLQLKALSAIPATLRRPVLLGAAATYCLHASTTHPYTSRRALSTSRSYAAAKAHLAHAVALQIPEFRTSAIKEVGPDDLFKSFSLSSAPDKPVEDGLRTLFTTNPASFSYAQSDFYKLRKNTRMPEVCILGRSNVGKSSLVNAVADRAQNGLAKVSSKAGKTKSINMYGFGPAPTLKELAGQAAEYKGKEDIPSHTFQLVDLPGYGHRSMKEWGKHISLYLSKRDALKGAVLLIDAEVGPKQGDLDALELLSKFQLKTAIILTKADKVKGGVQGLHDTCKKVWDALHNVEQKIKEGNWTWEKDIFVTASGAKDAIVRKSTATTARLAVAQLAGLIQDNRPKVARDQRWTGKMVSFDDLEWAPTKTAEPATATVKAPEPAAKTAKSSEPTGAPAQKADQTAKINKLREADLLSKSFPPTKTDPLSFLSGLGYVPRPPNKLRVQASPREPGRTLDSPKFESSLLDTVFDIAPLGAARPRLKGAPPAGRKACRGMRKRAEFRSEATLNLVPHPPSSSPLSEFDRAFAHVEPPKSARERKKLSKLSQPWRSQPASMTASIPKLPSNPSEPPLAFDLALVTPPRNGTERRLLKALDLDQSQEIPKDTATSATAFDAAFAQLEGAAHQQRATKNLSAIRATANHRSAFDALPGHIQPSRGRRRSSFGGRKFSILAGGQSRAYHSSKVVTSTQRLRPPPPHTSEEVDTLLDDFCATLTTDSPRDDLQRHFEKRAAQGVSGVKPIARAQERRMKYNARVCSDREARILKVRAERIEKHRRDTELRERMGREEGDEMFMGEEFNRHEGWARLEAQKFDRPKRLVPYYEPISESGGQEQTTQEDDLEKLMLKSRHEARVGKKSKIVDDGGVWG